MQINLNKLGNVKKIYSSPHADLYFVTKTTRKSNKRTRRQMIAKYYLDFECSDTNIRNLEEEIKYTFNIYHPALNKYFGFSPIDEKNNPKLIIFSEHRPKGSLSKYIIHSNDNSAPAKLDDTQKLIIAYGIASGMEFLHSKNIVHRHLKLDNIYLNDELNPKISGFFSSIVPITDSPIYLAPEIIANHKYSKEGDVYAFGIIAYEIFTSKKPFEQLETSEQIFENVTNGKRPELNSSTNSSIIKLIESCWSQNPSNRPTFEEIVANFENNPDFVQGKDEKRFFDYIDKIKKVYQSKNTKKEQEEEPKSNPPTESTENKSKQKQSDPNQTEKVKQTSTKAEEIKRNTNTNKMGTNRTEKREPIKNSAPNVNLRYISPSKVKPQQRLYQKGEIHFTSDSDFDNFQTINWPVGDVYKIEFFPTVMTTVILLDASSDITSYVAKMKQDSVIFLDLEYVMPYKPAPPVCLFQFCCSSGAFLFKQSQFDGNPQMRNFLSVESGCKFVGKGVSGDVQRLKEMFGNDFEIDLEDVENTRLLPYGSSANFDQMVAKFAGKPSAQFKDKKVSRSNWSKRNLSMKQVIYSAFDVVSLFNCYPNFPPIRHFEYSLPSDRKRPSNIDIMKEFSIFVNNTKKLKRNQSEIEEIWNSNPEFVAEMLGLNLNVIDFVVHECLKVMQGHKLACKLCNKSAKFVFTFKLVNHCLNSHPEFKNYKNKVDFKRLFLDYLFMTGRTILEKSECLICGECFNSNSELVDHCWNKHSDLLNEFLKAKQNKKQHQSDDNDNDDDDDDHSINDNDNNDCNDDDDNDDVN